MVIWILEICCYLIIATRFSINIIKKIANLEGEKSLAFIVPIFIFGVSLLFKNYATIKYFESSIDFYLIYFIVLFLGIGILILANLKKKKIN